MQAEKEELKEIYELSERLKKSVEKLNKETEEILRKVFELKKEVKK